jgi:hypothetical protein
LHQLLVLDGAHWDSLCGLNSVMISPRNKFFQIGPGGAGSGILAHTIEIRIGFLAA